MELHANLHLRGTHRDDDLFAILSWSLSGASLEPSNQIHIFSAFGLLSCFSFWVMDSDDEVRAPDDRWLEAILFFQPITHLIPYWGIFPLSVKICRSPRVCMIILIYEIHIRLMIRFHFVLILSWSLFLESFRQAHTFWFCCDFCIESSQAHRIPHHHFSGTHVRSFINSHGVILGLSW